jgi:hypothetical protein
MNHKQSVPGKSHSILRRYKHQNNGLLNSSFAGGMCHFWAGSARARTHTHYSRAFFKCLTLKSRQHQLKITGFIFKPASKFGTNGNSSPSSMAEVRLPAGALSRNAPESFSEDIVLNPVWWRMWFLQISSDLLRLRWEDNHFHPNTFEFISHNLVLEAVVGESS